jgi:hypothetical protein
LSCVQSLLRVAAAQRGAHRRHEPRHLQRIGETQAQAAGAQRARRERAHIVDLRQHQRVVVILEPGLKHAADLEFPQTRLGQAGRRCHRHQQRQPIADPHAELIGDVAADDHRIAARLEGLQRALDQQRRTSATERSSAGSMPRSTPAASPANAPPARSARYRARPRPRRAAPAAAAQRRSPSAAGGALIDHARLGAQRQQAVTQLAFEAVHDRQDHDQRGDAERHAARDTQVIRETKNLCCRERT